jgi:hypothetical protein
MVKFTHLRVKGARRQKRASGELTSGETAATNAWII